jgi:DNA topoisomerase II
VFDFLFVQDGSHIKGLVMNFFRHVWPKLLEPPIGISEDDYEHSSFMSSFITPLLKATKKGSKTVLSFYSSAEYNEWKEKMEAIERRKWNIKYYKGLGTSTPSEAKGYFKDFENHVKHFRWNSDADGEALDMVFDKNRASDRRDWILHQYDENSSLHGDIPSMAQKSHSYRDFVNKELIHFSHADNIRSIPSAIDGLKPSQRKVLYACFKRKLTDEIKVAQLSGYCAEHTAYHHGEASLQSTSKGYIISSYLYYCILSHNNVFFVSHHFVLA